MALLDITLPLSTRTPPWPGEQPLQVESLAAMADGAAANLSALHLSAHLGTHMDAPRHFLPDGATIDQLDLDLFVGPARVVRVADSEHVSAEDLRAAMAGRDWPRRLLLRTRNSAPGGALDSDGFDRGFCGLLPDAAELIVSQGVGLIGLDYLSIAPYSKGERVHQIILGAGVGTLEGLDLRRVEPGEYTLIALPLRLVGLDGSPMRAVLVQA